MIAAGNLLNHGVPGERYLIQGLEILETRIFFHHSLVTYGGLSTTAGSYEKFNDDYDQHDMNFISPLSSGLFLFLLVAFTGEASLALQGGGWLWV